MFRERVISSILLISFVIVTIFVFPPSAFALVAAIFIGLSLYELFMLLSRRGIAINMPLGIILGIAMTPIAYFDIRYARSVEPIFLYALFVILFLFQFMRKNNIEAIQSVSATFFAILYVGWLFSFLVKLRLLDSGEFKVAYILLVTKSGDIGAYLAGSRLGRHKLIPRLSPNKTIEGFIGGIAMSIIVAIAFGKYLLYGAASAFNLALIGVIFGLLAQGGDLAESLIKRDCQVKDAGRLIPGLGGTLDIIDSILFTAPVFYFYVKLLKI